MWVADYQRKEPQNFLVQSGLVGYCLSHMSQRNLRIHGEVKTEEIKVKRMRKDVKFRMMFKGSNCDSIIHGFCLKVLLVAGFVIGLIFLKKMLGKISTNLML